MKKIALLSVIVLLPVYAGHVPAAPPAPLTVSTRLDQTAVWVGDVLRYTLHVVHPADVEVVLDNFKKDLLPVAPFVLRDVQTRRSEWAGGNKSVEIVLSLTSFDTGKPELTIPPLPVYYFRHQAGLAGKESPVESVSTPAVKIGLRSTLVPARPAPREAKIAPTQGLAMPLTLLALGLAGLLGLAARGGWATWRRLHPDQADRRLTRQQREQLVQQALARVRADATAAGDDPRRVSTAIAAALRGLVAQIFQVPAAALTPDEIESALARADVNPALAADIKNVLTQCEQLQYGKDADGAKRPRTQLLPAAEQIMRSPLLVVA